MILGKVLLAVSIGGYWVLLILKDLLIVYKAREQVPKLNVAYSCSRLDSERKLATPVKLQSVLHLHVATLELQFDASVGKNFME